MSKKKNNAIFLILILVAVGAFAIYYNFGVGGQVPPPPPAEDIDTDGDGIPDASVSLSIFQPLWIVYTDGTSTWKYPTSRTSLTQMTVYDTDPYKKVASIQAYLYFTVISSLEVNEVTFSAMADVNFYDVNKNLYKNVASNQPISHVVVNPVSGEDTYIISSTISATEFQELVVPEGVQFDYNLYYNVAVKDISAYVTFANGNSATFGLTGVQATENQLWWKCRVMQSGTTMSILDYGVEWTWT